MSLKTLHRIYFGFDGEPDRYLGYLETWKRQLPEFEIKLWNAENLPVDNCEFSRIAFAAKDHAFLSDYFRWWVLKEFGGIYLDADIEVVSGSKFSRLISDLEVDPTESGLIGIDNRSGGWYTAHSMAAKKGSKLPSYMVDVYEGLGRLSIWRRKIFYFMAPQLTALYFADAGHNPDGMGSTPDLAEPRSVAGIKILPQDYFSPMTPATGADGKPRFVIDGMTERTCLCHHFSCSWHDVGSPYYKLSPTNRQVSNLLLEELIGEEDVPVEALPAKRRRRTGPFDRFERTRLARAIRQHWL